MRLTVEAFALQSARLRRVVDYLSAHLDEDITLARLADLACLSPSQLDRVYFGKIRETPFATLRRLRLKRALAQVRAGNQALQDIGCAAGYGSQAAFTRAFVRQFGHPPSRLPLIVPADPVMPRLRLELLEEREVFQVGYEGISREQRGEVGILVGNLAVGGARHWRNWKVLDTDRPFCAEPADHVSVHHFVPAAGLPHTVRNIDRVWHRGGLYAVYETLEVHRPRTLHALVERIREELCCAFTGGRILLREITVGGYTAPQERRVAYYVPVCRLNSRR